jgi:peroxiredoxin
MADVTIAAEVEEMRRSAPTDPDSPMAAFDREQAELAKAPPPGGLARVGDVLPDADLLDVDGSPVSLGDAVGGGLAVIVLYRGAWCPYCNIALRTYQSELVPRLRDRGIGLIAVSPQKPDGSLTMKEKHDLDYAVLSDPGLALGRAMGVLTGPSEEAREAQLELGLDLTDVNADETATLPMPTVAIVDEGLAIRWIDAHPDYTTRTEPAEILAGLDTENQKEETPLGDPEGARPGGR